MDYRIFKVKGDPFSTPLTVEQVKKLTSSKGSLCVEVLVSMDDLMTGGSQKIHGLTSHIVFPDNMCFSENLSITFTSVEDDTHVWVKVKGTVVTRKRFLREKKKGLEAESKERFQARM